SARRSSWPSETPSRHCGMKKAGYPTRLLGHFFISSPQLKPQAETHLVGREARVLPLQSRRPRSRTGSVPAEHVAIVDLHVAVAEIDLHVVGDVVGQTGH